MSNFKDHEFCERRKLYHSFRQAKMSPSNDQKVLMQTGPFDVENTLPKTLFIYKMTSNSQLS